jgi:transglutaminase superfamily protein
MGSSMWHALKRYRELNPEARKLFHRAAVMLPCVALSLHLRGFKKTAEALEKKLSSSVSLRPQTENPATLAQLASHMVKAAGRYGILRPSCLAESLTLWFLLKQRGVAADLRIGVRKTAQKFEAHAWVEYAGAALNQTEEQHLHYAAFDGSLADLPGEKP